MVSLSFRREVLSGSSHPRLVSDCLADIDLATSKDDLDHSGFVFDKHNQEFETLDSKIAKGIMEIIPVDFMRKINFLDGKQYLSQRAMLTARQIVDQILSFFRINQTQGHTMNLNDPIYMKLYNDKPQSVQAEETL